MKKTEIIAHRGSKGTHPENTLIAFEEAIQVGSDGIELDVHLTRDGEVVVIHDETIDRTSNGRGLVREFSLKKLKMLDMGSWFDSKFKSCTIPTLQEVIDLLNQAGFNGLLNIELKTNKFDYPGIERKVVEKLSKQANLFSVVFSSFNYQTLIRLNTLDRNLDLALLFEDYEENKTRLDKKNLIKMFHPSLEWFKNNDKKQSLKYPVRLWTINSEEDLVYCFSKKVFGIFTDFPQKAIAIRDEN